ncbi:MAG: NUDIX domain-containing protein [Leptonema sp. (in: bacteria)]
MKNGKFQITQKLLLWDKNFFLYLKDKVTNLGDLPGGRIHQKELYNLQESLIREVREELGNIEFEVQPEPVLVFPHYVSKDKEDSILILYNGNYWKGNITLSDEHSEYKWLHKKTPLENYFSDTLLIGLKKYFLKL